MTRRVLLLLTLLFLRFSLGCFWLSEIPNHARIKITGNIDYLYQKNSFCIIVVGQFWSDYRGECRFSQGDEVSIIGRVNSKVIDRFWGRLWLDNAVIDKLTLEITEPFSEGMIMSLVRRFRERMVSVYRRHLPVPESSLVAGIVLGYKKDIGSIFYDQMVKSGTLHIAVASGYNIMLVGGTVMAMGLFLMKRKYASILAILVMCFYALEAGGEPPVVRATVMAGAVFLAQTLGRKVISWWILLVAGWFLILFDPLMVVNVSFQLSMAASVGLLVLEPAVGRWLADRHQDLAEVLRGSGFLSSVSTMVLTTPIIWWHFARVSWIGIVSNILILPLVPILMITGALMQILPWMFYWPSYVVAHWMVGVIRFFGS